MASAKALAVVVEGHPFYIQKAIQNWHQRKRGETMANFCLRIACKADDPFEFADLDKRLGSYFGRGGTLAKSILDMLATQENLSINEISNLLLSEREKTYEILSSLEKDGYVRAEKGRYRLIQTLFRNWWLEKRGDGHV